MAFWGRTFIFDGVPSELYSMVITSTDGEEGSTTGSGNVELKTEKIFRRIKPYFYGTEQSEVLEIPVRITTDNTELSEEDSAFIQRWLFGKQNYKKMQIVQDDMSDYYFNCFLNDVSIIRVGNIIRGFECTMVCDSQFAIGYDKVSSYLYQNTTPLNVPESIYNYSDNNFYTYPIIDFTLDHGTNFKLVNVSDANRTFEFTNLPGGAIIRVDNDRQIITNYVWSDIANAYVDSGINYLSSFNKNFFRMVRGNNSLLVSGGVYRFSITYAPLKRIA